jgi:SAM-dependent methyltransferase
MPPEPEFRADLYRGTAPFYDAFRIPYPQDLLDDLRVRAQVTGAGRLLDLACGTGQIAFGQAESADRVPAGPGQAIADAPHPAVLAAAGFTIAGAFEFTAPYEWTVQKLTGFMYSTSILSRAALGRHAQAFERDLRDRLTAAQPDEVFHEEINFGYDLARRP